METLLERWGFKMEIETINRLGLEGKKYLVTGASSGIGRAAAILISGLGAKVVLNGRREEELRKTYSMMEGKCHDIMPFDLTNLEGINAYIKECIDIDHQKFDGMVFSTGVTVNKPIRSESIDNLEYVMKTNFYSYFTLLHIFSSKRVLNEGGSIVAVSSRSSTHPNKAQASYGASKAAIDAVSNVAAREFANRKIRVNTVQPNMTLTPMIAGFIENTTEEQREDLFPLGILEPEDIAGIIVFLLSDLSKKITGEHIYLSSGNDNRPINYLVK